MEDVVIVTGAAGSIGSAVARRLAEDGARLVLTDIDDTALAKAAIDVPTDAKVCVAGDVQSFPDVAAVVDRCVKEYGTVDAVVNVAGGPLGIIKPIWEMESDEFQRVVRTNLTGSFHWIKAVSPKMIEQRRGHIILVASGSGVRPGRMLSAYSASKAGVIGLMRAAALDLGVHNVKVNALCPGFTPREGPPGGVLSNARELYRPQIAIDELSTPGEFADFVAFLLTTRVISAQVMALDSKMLF